MTADPGKQDSGSDPRATTPVSVILALGSNLGDRRAHLENGLMALEPEVAVEAVSRLVESEPWGPVSDQPRFLNAVVRGATRLSPLELLDRIGRAELASGRVRSVAQGPRTLDIDIVFYGDRTIARPELQVPHPHWRERPFVARLIPEVADGMLDPRSGHPLDTIVPSEPLGPGLEVVAPLRPTSRILPSP